jgi:hypothetical protein
MIVIVEAHYGMAGLSCEDGVNEALIVDEGIIHGMKCSGFQFLREIP